MEVFLILSLITLSAILFVSRCQAITEFWEDQQHLHDPFADEFNEEEEEV